MKLKRAAFEGFRGAPVRLDLQLGTKSLLLLGENGHGKTTIVDGLELWSSGDVKHYHREGYRLDCMVNVDADSAVVRCETTVHPPLVRTLSGDTVSVLQPEGPMSVGTILPPELPVLRHRTMADFMDKSPGDKKKVLLDLFGLEALESFRQTLRRGRTTADRRRDDADRDVTSDTQALDLLRRGQDVVSLAETLRREANLAQAIRSEGDLLRLDLQVRAVPTTPDRVRLVTELTRAAGASGDDASEDWNVAVMDRETALTQSMTALLAAGERVLSDWEENSCPLCRQPLDRDDLLQVLQQRVAELRESEQRFTSLREDLGRYKSRLTSLLSSLERLLESPPDGGWPASDQIRGARTALRDHIGALDAALRDRTVCPSAPAFDLPDLAILEEAARPSSGTGRATEALADLVRLQEAFRRLQQAKRKSAAARAVAAAMSATLEIADDGIRLAIEGVLSRIAGVAAAFYGRLVANPVYSDIELEYRPEYAGGIEFSLLFDGRHRVSPPQRVLSESQLNAMGLALFLARVKVDSGPWRTIVLDDVVNSFDANHRAGLARLLSEEFADWQVLIFTHDRVFWAFARKLLATGWRFAEIAAWTPKGGPVLIEGGPREQLRARLAEGRSAAELGGLARVALEQGLGLPLEKLGLEIRYDSLARYSAYDFLLALRRGLRDRSSTLAGLPVLARMEAAAYLTTLGAHDRPIDPGLSTEDLRHLVDDLLELEEGFICTACRNPVWALSLDGGRHHQCGCSALAV